MSVPRFVLDGRVVLVTGGGTGIGRQIALTLAGCGARIALGYFEEQNRLPQFQHAASGLDRAQEVVQQIRSLGRKAAAVEGNLADPPVAAALVDQAEDLLGPLYAVVNNAAHCELPDDLNSACWDGYKRHFDVNFGAPAMLMATFARKYSMRNQSSGRIVNISTDSARAFPGQIFYGASKAALEALTRAAAMELGPRGITVNCVAPGPVQTGWISEELSRSVLPAIPMRRLGVPADIAEAVAFLLSDAASWITGQVLQVAGGHAL